MTLLMRDQENIEKGREEGREQKEKEIVLKMLHNHVPEETVSELTGIEIKRILEIKKGL